MKIIYTITECNKSVEVIGPIATDLDVHLGPDLVEVLRSQGGRIEDPVGTSIVLDETAGTITIEYNEQAVDMILTMISKLRPVIVKVVKVIELFSDIWDDITSIELPPIGFGSTAGFGKESFPNFGFDKPEFNTGSSSFELKMEEVAEDEKGMYKVCVECGSKNAIDDKFCFHCGIAFRE